MTIAWEGAKSFIYMILITFLSELLFITSIVLTCLSANQNFIDYNGLALVIVVKILFWCFWNEVEERPKKIATESTPERPKTHN